MLARSLRRPALTLGATLIALPFALTGCGSSSSGSATTTPAPAASAGGSAPSASTGAGDSAGGGDLAAMVPEKVKADGKLTFGSDASYPPSEFIDADGKTVIGMDVDLGKAIAAKLGLEADFQNANFDSIIPGLDSGKFEAGMSSFTINADRMKVVNMVSYFTAGTSWATAAGNPAGVTPDGACGKKIAVQKATVQVPDLEARSQKCVAAGKGKIQIDQYTAQTDATTAVVSGKDDAMLADSPVIAYAIKQTSGKLAKTGDSYDAAPYGIAVPKSSGDLAKAIQAAVQAIMADGSYQQILEKWGTKDGAIETSELNPAS